MTLKEQLKNALEEHELQRKELGKLLGEYSREHAALDNDLQKKFEQVETKKSKVYKDYAEAEDLARQNLSGFSLQQKLDELRKKQNKAIQNLDDEYRDYYLFETAHHMGRTGAREYADFRSLQDHLFELENLIHDLDFKITFQHLGNP